jgi:hypothetical protein
MNEGGMGGLLSCCLSSRQSNIIHTQSMIDHTHYWASSPPLTHTRGHLDTHRVLVLRKEIVDFYSTKNKKCPLSDDKFLTSLAFLVDLLTHVNTLNQSLQGKNYNCLFRTSKVARVLRQMLSSKKSSSAMQLLPLPTIDISDGKRWNTTGTTFQQHPFHRHWCSTAGIHRTIPWL